jgi:hypothetical protein
MTDIRSLSEFVAPTLLEEFIGAFYQQKPLLLQGLGRTFDGLFGWHDMNRILWQQRWNANVIRLCRDGQDIPQNSY